MRLAISALDAAALMARIRGGALKLEDVQTCLQRTQVAGDRAGDNHYDLASAYQKSMRGSDVQAAVYYLARFLESGEDPRFIARRLLVTASEDVGNADPQAFVIASHAYSAVERLGLPECKIPLSQAAIYVANAPHSFYYISYLNHILGLTHHEIIFHSLGMFCDINLARHGDYR